MRARWLRFCCCCASCEPEGSGRHSRDPECNMTDESPYRPNSLLKKMSYIDSDSSCSSTSSKEPYSQEKNHGTLIISGPIAATTGNSSASNNPTANGSLNRRLRLSVVVSEDGVVASPSLQQGLTAACNNAITPKSTGSSHHEGMVSSAKVQVATESPNHRPRAAWCESSDQRSSGTINVVVDCPASVHHHHHHESKNNGNDGGCGNAYRPTSFLKIPFIDGSGGGGGGKDPPGHPASAQDKKQESCGGASTLQNTTTEPGHATNGTTNGLTTSVSSNGSLSRKLRLSFFADDSPTQGQPASITVRMKPDEQGRFGFNVKGGQDQQLPILVSRVAPNTPADTAIPKLNEGDQVLTVNAEDVSGLTHDEVVVLIRCTKNTQPGGELTLVILPNVYPRSTLNEGRGPNGTLASNGGMDLAGQEDEEPAFEYIPVDASPASRLRVKKNALEQSMALLNEHLETGAVTIQFEGLYRKRTGESMAVSRHAENMHKNRYRDIMPYDSTRVILKESLTGDYINASFVNMEIPSSGIINRYIATQGPLTNTCEDFWQMVWEQGCHLVVMVTPLVERGRLKCLKYWPDPGEVFELCPRLQVTCGKEVELPSMIERELVLTHVKSGERREITHIQYTSWPDHGVPDDASDFLSLVNKVRAIRCGSVDPVIVHCSAGIGRTGVLIMMETAMCLIEGNEPIYPIEILRSMRDQRAMLIQTAGQFHFVCSAIYKVYKEGIVKPQITGQSTVIATTALPTAVGAGGAR